MFITHDLGVIREMCDRVVIMYCGEIVETAKVDELFANPSHPYTNGLLSTLPQRGVTDRLPTIPGMVPPAGKFPSGCVFEPRCPHACQQCKDCKPDLYDIGNGHSVRCFRYQNTEVK